MKTLNMKILRSWYPCYDPSKYLPEDWQGTALDILDHQEIPHDDKLWAILREDLMSKKDLRVFAVWCVRQVQHLITDERSLHALDVMDAYNEYRFEIEDPKWIEGWELEKDAARDAARDAASHAAWAAAKAAASHAARDARAAQRDKLREILGGET